MTQMYVRMCDQMERNVISINRNLGAQMVSCLAVDSSYVSNRTYNGYPALDVCCQCGGGELSFDAVMVSDVECDNGATPTLPQ